MWRWIHGMSPRTYPATPSFVHKFLTVVKIWTSRVIKDTVIVTHQSNQGTSPKPAEWEPLVSREPTTRRAEEKA